MPRHSPVAHSLDVAVGRIVNDHDIELEVDRLDDLFEKPAIDPFDGRARPLRAGIDELGATLKILQQLPGRAVGADHPAVRGAGGTPHRGRGGGRPPAS